MQLRTFFLPVSVLATTAALSPAIAQDFYVEGAVGAMEETTYISSNSNLDTNVVGGRVGWEVTPYLAIALIDECLCLRTYDYPITFCDREL